MDETHLPQGHYASFLVRLWYSTGPAPEGPQGDWQGEVEHIQSGERRSFASVGELLDLLCQPQRASDRPE